MFLGLLPSWIFSKTRCVTLLRPRGTAVVPVRQGPRWGTRPSHIGACIRVAELMPGWDLCGVIDCKTTIAIHGQDGLNSISGLVAEYIVAIDVTRARFPADACLIT